ncbi:type II secretion system protein [Okeanomitos corallinicola TIOX110]|uniref:Type II secretion system protein n=1 Tax=Okeanomitos corallinicola TIOX110 TaxID=3133117 RepID=A0ABZ2USM9_9CYAN
MRHINALNNNQGFTITEVLTVVVIVGILMAFSAPSFLAWNHRKQVDSAITNIEGAIKEAQRQAIAKSKTCNIAFDTTIPRVTSNGNTCLITGDRTLENVSLATSISDFNFNLSGESSSQVTVVVTHNVNNNLKKCLVVSSPLGLIGKGDYTGTGTTFANCNP